MTTGKRRSATGHQAPRRRLCIIVTIRSPISSGRDVTVVRLYNQAEMLTASMAESPEFVAKTPGPGHEFDLLCVLTAAEPGPHRQQEIANWNPSQINWQELVRLAEHHGVLPLAARNLTKHGHPIPPEIERSLRSSYESNLKRSLWFTAEM